MKMSIEEHISEKIDQLEKFKIWWQQELSRRYPDEAPDHPYIADNKIWRERFEDFLQTLNEI